MKKAHPITFWRIKREMTQTELAKKSGIGGGQPRIHDFESGKKQASIATLKKLAKALNTKWTNLLEPD